MKSTLKNIVAASIAAIALNANADVLTFDGSTTPEITLGGSMLWNGIGGGHLYMENYDNTDTITFNQATFIYDFQMNYQPWQDYGLNPAERNGWLVDIKAYDSNNSLLWSQSVDLAYTANDWGNWKTVSVNTANVSLLSFGPTGGTNGYWPSIDNMRINAVPEPETYAMLLAGLGLIAGIARRRKQ